MFKSDIPFYRQKTFKWMLDNSVVVASLLFSLVFRMGPSAFVAMPKDELYMSMLLIPLGLTLSSVFFKIYSVSWKYFATSDLKSFFSFYSN